VSLSQRKIYVFREVGGKETTTQGIANMISPLVGSNEVICDSSENRTTEQLREIGIDARKVYKRRGNVNDSNLYCIQWLKFFTLVVDKSCVNLTTELDQYAWQKNKEGDSISKAEDGNDHYIQSVFYALNDVMGTIKPSEIY
jgi:phage terminase large subunit